MRSFLKTNTAILIILLVAFFLRIVDIERNSLYGDELTITLDAYSLLKTGHDQLGNLFPLTFSMGAGRPAGYVYGSIPFIILFGPSALGVRALSILSGIGIVVLLYLTGRKLLSKKTGIIAAGFGAISPWEISLSRGGFEAHFALLLVLLGCYLFLIAKEKPFLYILSAIFFGLTLHTYPTYKVSLLLFFPLLFWFQNMNKLWRKSYFVAGVIIFLSFGVLALSQTLTGGSEARFASINIFSQKELRASIEQKINLERQISELPGGIVKFFHNKPVEYAKVFLGNYLKNFSLEFLVLQGDGNPRHNMATMGELYFIEIILIAIGFLSFWQKERKLLLFLLLWVILAPIPSAVIDLPHVLRSSFMLPPLIILSALGFSRILNSRTKIPICLVVFLFFIQFVFFIQKLYFLSPNEYSNFWSYPAKLASEIAIKNENKFTYIFLSDKILDAEYAYPVYKRIDMRQLISQNNNRFILGNYKLKKLGNIYIGDIVGADLVNLTKNLSGSILYIGNPEHVQYLKNYETVEGLNSLPSIGLVKLEI